VSVCLSVDRPPPGAGAPTCYEVQFATTENHGKSRLWLNGYLLCETKNDVLSAAGYSGEKCGALVVEPGLGPLYGSMVLVEVDKREVPTQGVSSTPRAVLAAAPTLSVAATCSCRSSCGGPDFERCTKQLELDSRC
jgi:hypothetical protein